jgi:hypothetical protein
MKGELSEVDGCHLNCPLREDNMLDVSLLKPLLLPFSKSRVSTMQSSLHFLAHIIQQNSSDSHSQDTSSIHRCSSPRSAFLIEFVWHAFPRWRFSACLTCTLKPKPTSKWMLWGAAQRPRICRRNIVMLSFAKGPAVL